MALTQDERNWLDEKFLNLHKRLDSMDVEVQRQRTFETEINTLKVEIEKRPTLLQLLSAVAVSFGLGLSFASLLLYLLPI